MLIIRIGSLLAAITFAGVFISDGFWSLALVREKEYASQFTIFHRVTCIKHGDSLAFLICYPNTPRKSYPK